MDNREWAEKREGRGMDQAGQDDDAGKAEAEVAGAALVRERLLLALAGLKRPARHAAAEYDALAKRLAYMTPEALDGLAEFVLRISASGPNRAVPVCPAPDLIRAWAYNIQPPPPGQSAFVGSVMRSMLGLQARDEGWHVQLYRHLRRCGPPLAKSAYAQDKLRAEAQDDARLLERVRERIEAGLNAPEDRRVLAQWHHDLAEAEALVEEGCARRAAKAASQAAQEKGKAA